MYLSQIRIGELLKFTKRILDKFYIIYKDRSFVLQLTEYSSTFFFFKLLIFFRIQSFLRFWVDWKCIDFTTMYWKLTECWYWPCYLVSITISQYPFKLINYREIVKIFISGYYVIYGSNKHKYVLNIFSNFITI